MKPRHHLERFTPLLVDAAVLGLLFLSVRLWGVGTFIPGAVIPWMPLLIMAVLFAFFTIAFYLLVTDDDQRARLAAWWERKSRIQNRWLRWVVQTAVGVGLFLYGGLHFIGYVVLLLMGPVLESADAPIGIEYLYAAMLILSVIAFSVLVTYTGGGPDDPVGDQKRARARLSGWLSKRPWMVAWQYGLASVVLPVFAFWNYLSYVVSIPSATAVKSAPATRARLFRGLESLFGTIVLVLLHVEATLRLFPSAGEAFTRAVLLFIFLYLPLKLLVLLVHKKRLPLWAEVTWAGLFFVAQFMVLYTTVI